MNPIKLASIHDTTGRHVMFDLYWFLSWTQ